jgi:hypothetical protein
LKNIILHFKNAISERKKNHIYWSQWQVNLLKTEIIILAIVFSLALLLDYFHAT